MAIKELQTRIALKYDLYENWKDSELVLLPGEIGLCEIPGTTKTVVENGKTVSITTAPTVLFKVGNNEKTPFKNLPWASAKAADVYSWAKASEVKRDGKKLVFVGGKEDGSNLEVEFDYVTLDEVKGITDGLTTRIAALEESIGTGKVAEDITSIKGRLDAIEGTDGVDGTIVAGDKATLASAQSYADGKASAAETAAKGHADILNTAMNTRVEGLESFKASQETYNTNTTKAIADEASERATAVSEEATARDNADKAIEAKIGGNFTSENTVAKAISDAQAAAAQDATDKVNALANGQVDTNKTDIANIKDVLLPAEAKARDDADKELNKRLEDVEAFFHTAEGETLDTALDTLKEIQDYLNGEGTATGGIIDRVAQAEADIDNLQKEFDTSGRVTVAEDDIDQAEADIDALEGRADKLEAIVDGYGAEGDEYATVKAHVDAVRILAEKGITDAAGVKTYVDGTFKTAIEAYADQAEADAIQAAKDYVDPKFEAQDAANEAFADEDGRLAGLIGGNTTEINTLKNTTIPGVVSDYQAADLAINNKIGAKDDAATVDTVYGAIADAAGKADANTTRIGAVEGNYVKYVANEDTSKPGKLVVGKEGVDMIIFNCGSATEVI